MAQATVTLTVDNYPAGVNNIQREQKVSGTISVSASPSTYATGGLPISWAGLLNAMGEKITSILGIGLNATPVDCYFESVGGGLYEYGWNKATDSFQIFSFPAATVAGGPLYEELPNATAIPASVSGDTIRFEAWFIRNLG